MKQPLLVSIIINNYNYGQYLRQAIDSALQQAYSPIEVIVIDDGSTDGSQAVIAVYGDAILPVIKENRGQASTLNAGFARSTGDLIIFLDADDVLLPHTARQVAEAFQANPDAVKIQYRLAVIDAQGVRTGQTKPPIQKRLPSGDLRSQVLSFPDDIAWQPTSGNALRASVLRQIFPIPEHAYRICADYYLSNLVPLFGTVLSLDHIGGCYRVHGANYHHTTQIDVANSREIISRTSQTHSYLKLYADSLGLTGFPAVATQVASLTFLAHRMISLKLEPQHHPMPGDTIFSLFRRAARASFGRFDLPLFARPLYVLWFAAAAIAPRPAVKWLAKLFFYPETRGWIEHLIGYAQGQHAPELREVHRFQH